jgi:TRAP transporter TAXI family solute receptor
MFLPLSTLKKSILAASFTLTFAGSVAHAQPTDRLEIAATERNTFTHMVATNIAKVIENQSKSQLAVRTFAGTDNILAKLAVGEVLLAPIDSGEALSNFKGEDGNPAQPNLRLLMRGSTLRTGILVKKSAGIKTAADLKGKKVAGGFTQRRSLMNTLRAELALMGLTEKDVQIVTVGSVIDGMNALLKGEVDAAHFAVGAKKVEEADGKLGGVRFLDLGCGPKSAEILSKGFKGLGFEAKTMKGGAVPGVSEDTCILHADLYLLTHKAARADQLKVALKGLWEGTALLRASNPALDDWTQERAYDKASVMPYHDAAIEFFKAAGPPESTRR